MFTLDKTYVKENFQWTEKDISAMALTDVLKLQDGRFTIMWNAEYRRDFFVSVNRANINNADKALTLGAWVQTLEENALTTTNAAKGLRDSNVVEMYDFHEVASGIKRGLAGFAPDVVVPEGSATDIVFTTPYSSYDKRFPATLFENILAVVNGTVHPVSFQNDHIYVHGAYERFMAEGDQFISLIDFSNVGGIVRLPIEDAMLTQVSRTTIDEGRYATRFVIDAGVDLNDYVPMLILDGYIHTIDESAFQIVDKDKILVEVDHYLAMQRAARKPAMTRNWIDPANITKTGVNTRTFDARAYLNNTHSLIVLIKNKDIAFLREPLGGNSLERTYYHYRAPKGLVMFDDKMLAMSSVTDYNEYEVELSTMDNNKPTWTYETVALPELIAFSENGYVKNKPAYKQGYVLEMYSFA